MAETKHANHYTIGPSGQYENKTKHANHYTIGHVKLFNCVKFGERKMYNMTMFKKIPKFPAKLGFLPFLGAIPEKN